MSETALSLGWHPAGPWEHSGPWDPASIFALPHGLPPGPVNNAICSLSRARSLWILLLVGFLAVLLRRRCGAGKAELTGSSSQSSILAWIGRGEGPLPSAEAQPQLPSVDSLPTDPVPPLVGADDSDDSSIDSDGDDPPPVTQGPRTGRDSTLIRFATWNIRSGRNSRLVSVCRAIEVMRLDWCLLTETKLTDGIYPRACKGYRVAASADGRSNQGGVALVYKENEFYQVESIHHWGANVISFAVVSGVRRWHMVGAYVPPSDVSTMREVFKALDSLPGSAEPILLGDLNVDFGNPTLDARDQQIAADLVSYGFQDLLLKFRQRRRFSSRCTWFQRRNGDMVTARCDYILGMGGKGDPNRVVIRAPRLYDSDHHMVCGRLRSDTLRRNRAYLRKRKRFPLQKPKWGPHNLVDSLYQAVQENAVKAGCSGTGRRPKPEWISSATWDLIDQRWRMSQTDFSSASYKQLSRRIQKALKADRRRRAERAAGEVATEFARKRFKEGWNVARN